MGLARMRRLGSCGLAAAVLFGVGAGVGACGSTASSGTAAPPSLSDGAGAGGTTAASPSGSSSSPAPATASNSDSSKSGGGSAGSSSPATPALPKSAKGDHQKVVALMDAVQPSGLPIQKTADLGSTSRVYQTIAAHYTSQLLDLNATGYGDAESSVSTYIVVLGQLKPAAPLPNVVEGTLSALGATGIVADTSLGAHAAASSLVMSCGTLPNKYKVCVWTGGTGGDLFMGALETPADMSLSDTSLFAESVFSYVAP